MQKTLLVLGGFLILAGLLWPILSKAGLFRLPGDIVIERENFRFYFPLTTMVVISAAISLLLWLLRK
ncbi:DUF2905 domain-containing protein [Desulfurispira natronophila]|uniref:DUF2905 domain-containing protein n=1 Tax=Desulfurispira natronophila TaxID=682562 RepID=A0A7W8DGV7_9BACT|nr:DUF2905 domain-containing protein [Desulfurispira natronophila]MBB5021840.1 hypothetical protein [Desulfurispira natronophila]